MRSATLIPTESSARGNNTPNSSPADAGNEISLTHLQAYRIADTFQHAIAGEMPVGVVDAFEVVQIDEDQRVGHPLALEVAVAEV